MLSFFYKIKNFINTQTESNLNLNLEFFLLVLSFKYSNVLIL